MMTTPLNIVLAATTLACVAQFIYGMKRYFRQTEAPWALSLVKLGSLGGWGLALFEELHTPLEWGWRAIAALGLLVFSTLLFWAAVKANRQRPLTYVFSSDVPQHLVTWGPYRWIRHPFYTAYCAVFVSSATAVASPILVAWACGMVLLYGVAARREERKFASSAFAADYRSFQARTGMMLPSVFKILGRRAPDAGSAALPRF